MRFVGETEMKDLGLRKERGETEFATEPDSNE